MDKFKVIISDCHLSAGRFYEGHLNPHEDFHFDDEMCDFFEYFSTGEYGEGPQGAVEVELFINGDFFDFLNVPVKGEFDDAITEEIALGKCEAIIQGHPKVMAGLRRFASLPGKTITYLIGNHDADLFFEKVRARIIREWEPVEGGLPRGKVKIIADQDRVRMEGGVEVHHGNQFEAQHVLNFAKPVLESHLDQPVLNIPWGSFYVLKIINRLKWEREFLDKVRPVRAYFIFGLFFDTLFTIRFAFLSGYYFLKTRFVYSPKRRAALRVTGRILLQELRMFTNLEVEARELLDQSHDVKTVIFGHTHYPMNKVWPDGKQYINTGTWTKMINLDWRALGQQFRLTFAFVRIRDQEAQCELRHWVGAHSPHKGFHG